MPTLLSLYQIEGYRIGSIVNIGMGGCFFSVGEELPVGEGCQVTVTIGEGLDCQKITLSGQIIRSDSSGVGIRFTDNPPDILGQLEKIIACRAAGQ